MVQNGTTSIVCDRMMTQEISRTQSMPSAAIPGQRVIERAKSPYTVMAIQNTEKG